MSSGYVDFPFDYLHTEITNFFSLEKPTPHSLQHDASSYQSKLENMGFRVGYAMVERIAKDFPRFVTELDIMKFICKDFWTAVFRKQVDNLRTNHQGMYVITDQSFCFLASLSGSEQYKEEAPRYLHFSTGLVRGALANLGLQSSLTADVTTMPAVKFSIAIQPSG